MASPFIAVRIWAAADVRAYETHQWVCRGCRRQRFAVPRFVVVPTVRGRGDLKPRRCCSLECAEAYAVTLAVEL